MTVVIDPAKPSALWSSTSHISILHHETFWGHFNNLPNTRLGTTNADKDTYENTNSFANANANANARAHANANANNTKDGNQSTRPVENWSRKRGAGETSFPAAT